MKKIFIITAGSYSDYHIVTVFSDETLADDFVKEYPECKKETFLKDEYKPQLLGRLHTAVVKIERDGNIIECKFYKEHAPMQELVMAGLHSHTPYPGNPAPYKEWLQLRCLATDEAHAIKIAGETRSFLIAGNYWHASDEEIKKYLESKFNSSENNRSAKFFVAYCKVSDYYKQLYATK